ncbi:IL23A protein, partial [Geococcyx californianus]|nr:IL23A protein [Geococcyx californianus]
MAPLRHLRLCLYLCLCLPLPPPAVPAPAPAPTPVQTLRTDWAACRNLSRDLARELAALKEPHRALEDAHLSEEDPNNWPPRIRCSDACDPSTLDTNNTRCLQRILQGLQHYRDLLGSEIFKARNLHRLEAVLDQLLGLVQQEHRHVPQHLLATSAPWTWALQQRLALQRLQSFAAVMSRVFTHSAS